MTTERAYAGLILMYFPIPSLSLSLLQSSEVPLHSSSSAFQSTRTTETHLLRPTLPEQTPVIDLSSPTSLSKLTYYCGESCSTSCCPKIPCLTCLNLFISSQKFSIFFLHAHPIHSSSQNCLFLKMRTGSVAYSAASPGYPLPQNAEAKNT